MIVKYLIEKEIKQFLRNPFLPRMVITMPLMMMLVMPWVANLDIKNINVSIVDSDRSTYSERLVHKIEASQYFYLTDISASNHEAMQSIESNQADLILEIPLNFEKDLLRNGNAKVMISANSVNGTKGNLGSAYMASILSIYSNELRDKWVQSSGKTILPIINIVTQSRFNPEMDYKVFMIPALIVMLLTMICGFLPALNIVNEKETGTIEQINVTPVSKFSFIIAKLIPYWIIGFIVSSLCFALAALVYGITPVGSLLTIYLFVAIYILAISGVGLVISNYSSTLQQAMFVIFFFMMVMILISGLYTPLNSMPNWAKALTTINPLKYFIQVMRAVYLKGSGISELTTQLVALLIFAVFFNSWAVLNYKKSN